MSTVTDRLKQASVENYRLMTWKHWVFIAIWELGGLLMGYVAISDRSASLQGAFWWGVAFVAVPTLPFLIPRPIQVVIGRVVTAIFFLLWGCFIVWAAAAYVVVWFAPEAEWAYRWRYSLEKDMDGRLLVSVERKSHDCDFWTAPLGSKHCHYAKQTLTVRIRTQSGQRQRSFDEGRTWGAAEPHDRPAVLVSWARVED